MRGATERAELRSEGKKGKTGRRERRIGRKKEEAAKRGFLRETQREAWPRERVLVEDVDGLDA